MAAPFIKNKRLKNDFIMATGDNFGLPAVNPIYINQQGSQLSMPQNTQLAGSAPMGTPQGSGLFGALGNALSTLNPIAGAATGLIGGAMNMIGASQQRKFESAEAQKQRDWNEAMADKQNEFNLDMWNKQNEYNTPAAQKQRLIDAGLNPLGFSLDGNSTNALTAAEPLGYERASSSAFQNPLAAGFEGFLSARQQQKSIELQNAQIDKIKADTASVGLDTEFKDKTMDARVEAENLGNALTKETIEKVKKEKRQVEANIDKLIAETKSEEERAGLIVAQKMLAKANEKEILELLPYKQLLMEAQTTAQKAAAAASFAHAAYERGLLNSGYIDKMVERMDAETARLKTAKEREEALAAKEKFITAIKTGELLQSDNDVVQGVYDVILNYPLKTLSTVSTVLDGFSPALLLAGAGKALSGLSTRGRGRVTNLVDSQGNPMYTTEYSSNY